LKNARVVSETQFQILLWEERENKADVGLSPLCPPEHSGSLSLSPVLLAGGSASCSIAFCKTTQLSDLELCDFILQ